ncbi:hypothetical protein V8D89_006650 [Ganoderma adspersum]
MYRHLKAVVTSTDVHLPPGHSARIGSLLWHLLNGMPFMEAMAKGRWHMHMFWPHTFKHGLTSTQNSTIVFSTQHDLYHLLMQANPVPTQHSKRPGTFWELLRATAEEDAETVKDDEKVVLLMLK